MSVHRALAAWMVVLAAVLYAASVAGADEPGRVGVEATVNVPPVPPITIDVGADVGQPAPPPPPPPAHPTISEAEFSPPPRVGRESELHIEASSTNAPVGGYIVNMGEPGGRFGAAACSLLPALAGAGLNPFAPGTTTAFELPFKFKKAGEHKISLGVTTGFGAGVCAGQEAITRTSFDVTVGKAPAKSRAATAAVSRGSGWLTARAAQAACGDDQTIPDDANVAAVAAATVCLVNAERAKAGLPALAEDSRLIAAATAHSQAMVQGRFFDHQGPSEPELGARGKAAGFLGAMAENIGYGTLTLATPASTVEGWMNSPPHRANMLDPRYKTVGMSVIAQSPTGPLLPGASYTANFGDDSAGGAPVPPAPSAAAARTCKPPNVKGKTLAAAKKAIKKAKCQLGKVTKPKKARKGAKLVVTKQSRTRNKVNVTLGPKKKGRSSCQQANASAAESHAHCPG